VGEEKEGQIGSPLEPHKDLPLSAGKIYWRI
jgi:hypothetical protein